MTTPEEQQQQQRADDPAPPPQLEQDLSKKIVLITGANAGIGKASTKQFVERGALVVMCCRSLTKADEARSEIMKQTGIRDHKRMRVVQLDLSDLDNVQSFPSRYDWEMADLLDRPIDIMVLNAGVLALPERELSKQGIEMQMATNTIGHFKFLALMYHRVKQARPQGRIVVTGSQFHKLANGKIDFEDFNREKHYNGWVVYSETKLGILLVMAKLNRLLEEKHVDHVIACSGHPGFANTSIHRWTIGKYFAPLFAQSPDKSARSIVFAATDKNAQRNGYAGPKWLVQLYGDPAWGSNVLPDAVFDSDLQDKFWQKCEELTGVNFKDKL